MGSGPSPKSVASIQLSSPSPSPLATPQQTTGCATSTMDNTYYPPPLVFHPPRNNPHGHLHMHSVYPLVDIPTPPELKRISNTSDNCITVLEETCPNQVNQLRANVHPPASSITLARMSLCIEPSPLPEQVQQQQLPVLSSSSCVPTPAPRTSTPSDSAFDDFSMSSDPAPAVDSPNSALPSPVSDVDDWASQQQQQDEPLLPPPALAIPLDPRSLHVSTPHPLPITPTTATHSSDRMVVDTIDTKKKTTDGMLTLLDTYDALPSNIQDYMMLQLLRRTPMSSLRFASDMIMQVLKTDFISKLPRRLAQQILLYLDVRSLCRATAVSRYWRQVIDQDSWLWRVKICEADFAISPHELLDYPAYLPPQLQPQQHPASFSSRQLSQHLHSLQQQQPPATPNTASSEVPSSSSSVCSEIRSPLLSSMDEMVQDGVMTEPFNLLQSASDVGPSYYDPQHPFKHIYKRHYLIQYNWRHNRAQRTQVQGHGEVVTCLQFDDDKIITGFDDNCINIYDIKTGQLRRKLLGHEGGVWALQYVGNTLVTGSTDRTLRIWDIERGICRYVFCGHSSTVRCLHIVMPTPVTLPSGEVVIQPDQPKIISGSRDHTLRVWHLPYLPAKGYAPPSSTSSASSAAFPSHSSLPHHRRSSSAHSISVKPSASAAQPLSSSYPHHTSSHHHHHATTSVSDDPQLMDDYQAATSSATTTPVFKTHHPAFSQEHDYNPFFVHLLCGHSESVRTLAAHGNLLASGSYDYTVRLWDLETGNRLHCLEGHSQKVYSVVIDPKNNYCISGSMDSTIRVWSIETGRCLHVLRGHTSLVGLLGLTDQYLVSAAADSSLRVWKTKSSECEHILSGPSGHRTAITSFQHDNDKVISGSEGGLKMWDIKTGALLHDLISDVHGVWRVAFDERRCVAAVKSESGTRLDILDYGADLD